MPTVSDAQILCLGESTARRKYIWFFANVRYRSDNYQPVGLRSLTANNTRSWVVAEVNFPS